MLEKKEKYDPAIYGKLKSEFLKSLDTTSNIPVEQTVDNQEELRQRLLREIKEGKLVPIKS